MTKDKKHSTCGTITSVVNDHHHNSRPQSGSVKHDPKSANKHNDKKHGDNK